MTLSEYLRGQLHEARSADNKWYCGQYYGHEMTDPKVLMEYYIRHGGTKHFAQQHQGELDACRAGIGAEGFDLNNYPLKQIQT